MTTDYESQRAALMRRLPDAELVKAARQLEAVAKPTQDQMTALVWLRSELDKRAGDLDDDRFCELLDGGANYTEAVLALAPHLAP